MPFFAGKVPHVLAGLKTSLKVGRHIWQRGIFAHTSPIYLAVGGSYWLYNQEAIEYMLTIVEGGLAYIRNLAPYHSHSPITHHHGEIDHQAYLERPFREAYAVLQRRLREQR